MKKILALGLAAAFSFGTFAAADDITIIKRDPDPETTGSIVVKERDPDVVVKKKVIIKEKRNDADLVIKGTVDVE
jgi:hypothetical protein